MASHKMPEQASDPIDVSLRSQLGSNIKQRRKQANLTQLKLATRSGVSRAMISEVESGKINITLLTARRIAAAFGIGISDLLN
jgi:transcriptional regulator with XRE-family HTH domain